METAQKAMRAAVAIMAGVIALLAAVTVSAQTIDISTVTGWGTVQWGASRTAVREKYLDVVAPVKAEKYADGTVSTPLRIPSLFVAGAPMRVSFRFADESDSAKLVAVSVSAIDASPSVAQFDALRNALTEKYGQPTTSGRTVRPMYADLSCVWALPKTRIELYYTRVLDLQSLGIAYSPTANEPGL